MVDMLPLFALTLTIAFSWTGIALFKSGNALTELDAVFDWFYVIKIIAWSISASLWVSSLLLTAFFIFR